MPVITQKWIKREDLIANREVLYVFGDNERRVGLGGQAKEMRGEPNAIGIATLESPGVFWSDKDYNAHCDSLIMDFAPVWRHLMRNELVVLPEDGVGTGLAQLEKAAPLTFAFLQGIWETLLGFK